MRSNRFFTTALLVAAIAAPLLPTHLMAAEPAATTVVSPEARRKKADESIAKAIAFLKTKQDANGSWNAKYGPAITALVVTAIIKNNPDAVKEDYIKKGIAYVLSNAQPDGGIYLVTDPKLGGILQNYNTSICLSMLARIQDQPGVAEKIKKAQDYLRGLQWAGQPDPSGKIIDENHPFYGGAGYGREGRPDMSNTHMMLEGLHDSGLDCNDPAFKRALVFIGRCQAADTNTASFRDKLSNDGGFVYTTSQSKDKIGVPNSPAGDESIDVPGKGQVKVLRSYGSMTYAGFKSYVYAQLDKKDPRVVAAWGWITKNYTVDCNPGFVNDPATPAKDMKHQGYYYYLMAFSRALDAWGEPMITTPDGTKHDWAAELVDKVVSLQKPDGSWNNENDRWAEGDPSLVTAYAIIAMEHAQR